MKWITFCVLVIAFIRIDSIALATARPEPEPVYSSQKSLPISLFCTGDLIEVSNSSTSPQMLSVDYSSSRSGRSHIATFHQDGDANAELVSIFKVKTMPDFLGVIVKWHYYLSGVNTEGDYYEVHTYRGSRELDKVTFLEEKKLPDSVAFGFDGKQEGRIVHFFLKDAASVRKKLADVIN